MLGRRGQTFSAKDKDVDASISNCAKTHKGAWWYAGCHSSNLNGCIRKENISRLPMESTCLLGKGTITH